MLLTQQVCRRNVCAPSAFSIYYIVHVVCNAMCNIVCNVTSSIWQRQFRFCEMWWIDGCLLTATGTHIDTQRFHSAAEQWKFVSLSVCLSLRLALRACVTHTNDWWWSVRYMRGNYCKQWLLTSSQGVTSRTHVIHTHVTWRHIQPPIQCARSPRTIYALDDLDRLWFVSR